MYLGPPCYGYALNCVLSILYGSLYVTLCFVLCRFYFGVLTFDFRILSFWFMCSVYDVVHFKRRHSRGRDKI